MKSCATCKHSSHSSDALECAHRPGYTTYEGGHCEDHTETNWQRYFGTPEKTATTLVAVCVRARSCFECPVFDPDGDDCPIVEDLVRAMEWLEADAE